LPGDFGLLSCSGEELFLARRIPRRQVTEVSQGGIGEHRRDILPQHAPGHIV
jgi:hypothetical protein